MLQNVATNLIFFFFQAEDGIRYYKVTGVQTCALPICIIRFSTALAEGDANGPVKAFMDYAAQNGPALRETMSAVGAAVSTLATAAADAGRSEERRVGKEGRRGGGRA